VNSVPGFRLVLETPPLPTPGGPVKRRLAVRALIVREGSLLMVRSALGDWKFPGGGVEPRETVEQALAREVAEETGFTCRGRPRHAGSVVERAPGRDVAGSLFEMESRYFWTEVEGDPGPLHLDAYERKLGFEPGWIPAAAALAANRELVGSGRAGLPAWVGREIRVLELLLESATP
jgi:8-oxo-dGTP pyrophosphatase MutT (NUDIX family)